MTLKNIPLTLFYFAVALTSCSEQNSNDKIINFTATDKSGQLMNEEDFWRLIKKSKAMAGNNYQEQVVSLTNVLATLDASEIVKFDNTFTALMAASYNYNLWGAAYVINGGCSDDCFDYFREYLIGQGKDRFYQTVKDPESCAGWVKAEEEEDWQRIRYAAINAYKAKTNKDIPTTYQPKFELKGKPFDEETVLKLYPKLAKKFMGDDGADN